MRTSPLPTHRAKHRQMKSRRLRRGGAGGARCGAPGRVGRCTSGGGWWTLDTLILVSWDYLHEEVEAVVEISPHVRVQVDPANTLGRN